MACNNLGVFAIDTSTSLNLCLSAQTDTVYGDSLTIGQELYLDSGCTPGNVYSLTYLSNGVNLYETDLAGEIIGISGCSCNFLGTFASDSFPDVACLTPLSVDLYGTSLTTGSTVYSDSACTTTALTSFYYDGVLVYAVDTFGVIESI